MVSSSDDGALHVWRVDLVSGASSRPVLPARGSGLTVNGIASVRILPRETGPVVAVAHFNSNIASLIVYCTLSRVCGWDLRASEEVFSLVLRPELGHASAFALSPDRNWLCVGTSRGYLVMWDIRFQVMCKLWRHSVEDGPIRRLSCCKEFGSNDGGLDSFLFVAAGDSEVALWKVPDSGQCIKCFRSMRHSYEQSEMRPLPALLDVPVPSHPMTAVRSAISSQGPRRHVDSSHSVRAFVGRLSSSPFLITAGTDRNIRYTAFCIHTFDFVLFLSASVKVLGLLIPNEVLHTSRAQSRPAEAFIRGV